jgi:hypothetical protein
MSKLSLSSRKARASIAVLLATVAASAWAWDAGRMTGGGSIICPAPAYRVTFGYELHCQPEKGDIPGPNNLEVNFSTGEHFHLTTLTKAVCSGPDATTPNAPFNTLTGAGSGTLNGEAAMIRFVLVDNGEPGTQDTAKFVITVDSWEKALYCGPKTLEGGNNQAHQATGNKP